MYPNLLRPLFDLQRKLVIQSPVLWTDDTPVTVLVGGKEGSRQGRFWTYIGATIVVWFVNVTVGWLLDKVRGPAVAY